LSMQLVQGFQPTVLVIHQRYRQTCDMQSQDCTLHYSTSTLRGKTEIKYQYCTYYRCFRYCKLKIPKLLIDPALDDDAHPGTHHVGQKCHDVFHKKLSYRRETARQLPTRRGLSPPVHSPSPLWLHLYAYGRIRIIVIVIAPTISNAP